MEDQRLWVTVKLVVHRLIDPLRDGGQPVVERQTRVGLFRPAHSGLRDVRDPPLDGRPPALHRPPVLAHHGAGEARAGLVEAGGRDGDGLHPPVWSLHLDVNVLRDSDHVVRLALTEHVLVDHLHLDCVPVLVLAEDGDHLVVLKTALLSCPPADLLVQVDVHLELFPQLGVTGEGTEAAVEVETPPELPVRLPLSIHGGPLGEEGGGGGDLQAAELGAAAEEPELGPSAWPGPVLGLLLHETHVEVAQTAVPGVTLHTEHVLRDPLDQRTPGLLRHAVHLPLDLGSDVEVVHGTVSEHDGSGLHHAWRQAGGDVRTELSLRRPGAGLHVTLRLGGHHHRRLLGGAHRVGDGGELDEASVVRALVPQADTVHTAPVPGVESHGVTTSLLQPRVRLFEDHVAGLVLAAEAPGTVVSPTLRTPSDAAPGGLPEHQALVRIRQHLK